MTKVRYKIVQSRHTRKRYFFSISLVLILVFILLILTFNTEFFSIREISVSGNQKIVYNEIIKLSGIQLGDNILKVDKNLIRQRLETNPYISVINIKRKLPDTLEIYITEREEKCIIPYLGSYIYVDQDSRVLKIEESIDAMDIPVVTGIDISSFTIGEKIDFAQREKVMLFMDIMTSLEECGLTSYISEVNIQDINNIIMFTVDGTEVLVGDSQQLLEKFFILKSAIEDINNTNRQSDYILDISVIGQAVLKPKDE